MECMCVIVLHIVHNNREGEIIVTCSAILALLDKDDDLRARHELLNTERILQIFQIGAEI